MVPTSTTVEKLAPGSTLQKHDARQPTRQTWDEIGCAEFPIVAACKKRPLTNTLCFLERIGRDADTGKEIHREWKMVGSEDFGLPYLPDLDVYVAILQLAERHSYEEKVLRTTANEICELAGVARGGTTSKRLVAGLNRFKFSGYAADRVFFSPGSREPILGESWSIVSTFRLAPDHQDAAIHDDLPPSYIALDVRFLNRLRNGQMKPVDLGIWRQLGSGLEKPIFRYLEKNLYRKGHFEIGAQKFTSRIGVLGRYNQAQLRRLYVRPFKVLVDLGFLAKKPEFQASKSPDDPEKIVFFPGKARTRTQKVRGVSTTLLDDSYAPEGAEKANSAPLDQSEQLIRRFMGKRHGILNPKLTLAMRKAATAILADARSFEEAAIAVDLAAADGRRDEDGRGFPRHLAGILESDYLDQAHKCLTRQQNEHRKGQEAQAQHELENAYLDYCKQRVKAWKDEHPKDWNELVAGHRNRINRDQLFKNADDERREQLALGNARLEIERTLSADHLIKSRAEWQRDSRAA